ncbi:hypothetical protein FS320_02320 [Microvirga tunisiensis]|uniref:Uncharacterized protein n=1 Tax=Microvirga tunisiensis TaxID=2108360 RepID=A0A5N7MBF2_9HYPH|nr:hypothetical protein [Microvirga tunisiensis]MPR06301.1 hypothetical protein [Microvirga tunisiensis]MPR24087.1 hypothetical protein [Microvirga tunisiensis]
MRTVSAEHGHSVSSAPTRAHGPAIDQAWLAFGQEREEAAEDRWLASKQGFVVPDEADLGGEPQGLKMVHASRPVRQRMVVRPQARPRGYTLHAQERTQALPPLFR